MESNESPKPPFLQEVVDVLNRVGKEVRRLHYKKFYFFVLCGKRDLVVVRLRLIDKQSHMFDIKVTYEKTPPDKIYQATREILIEFDDKFNKMAKTM